MWLWVRGPPWRPQPHEVNQTQLFGQLFHQEVLHMAQCGGNHLLPSDPHLSQWRSFSWCIWLKVHITNVNICSTHVPQVERFYMDPIRLGVHHESNVWQTQGNLVGNLVGKGECKWIHDLGWLFKTQKYLLKNIRRALGAYIKTRHFLFSHGFVLILMIFLFAGCKWNEWDSSPIHHKDLDTYATLNHAPIWSHRNYFYGCHIQHQHVKYHLFTLMAFDFHHTWVPNCLDHHELTNMQRFGGVVGCFVDKALLAYATLKINMIHCRWHPTRTPSIGVSCKPIILCLCII
jgi:hypothetical protein